MREEDEGGGGGGSMPSQLIDHVSICKPHGLNIEEPLNARSVRAMH